jgi:hypothetical protein
VNFPDAAGECFIVSLVDVFTPGVRSRVMGRDLARVAFRSKVEDPGRVRVCCSEEDARRGLVKPHRFLRLAPLSRNFLANRRREGGVRLARPPGLIS